MGYTGASGNLCKSTTNSSCGWHFSLLGFPVLQAPASLPSSQAYKGGFCMLQEGLLEGSSSAPRGCCSQGCCMLTCKGIVVPGAEESQTLA